MTTFTGKLGSRYSKLGRMVRGRIARLLASDPRSTQIAQVIADEITSLTLTPSMTAQVWDPGNRGLLPLPTGVVGLPIDRSGGTNAKSIGYRDWQWSYPVLFVLRGENLRTTQTYATELLEAFISAIDANPTLSGKATEARVTATYQPDSDTEQTHAPVLIDARVDVEWQERV
jgi:hypothetical protein